MIHYKLDNAGFVFWVTQNRQPIPFREWSGTDDCIAYAPLSELVDNGFAESEGCECTVPYENIYLIDNDDRLILGLPKSYDKAMRLRSLGGFRESGFSYALDLLKHAPAGDVLPYRRTGNVVEIGSEGYLLTEAQYKLVLEVEDFNATDPGLKTDTYNMLRFAGIKTLAQEAGCVLDDYLQGEEVYAPEKIGVQVTADEQGINVQPAIPVPENAGFQRSFDRNRKVGNRYNIPTGDGGRLRVILTPEQKEGLETLKTMGGHGKTKEEVQDLIQRPTEYFDPDAFDLTELYSGRVIEIGLYKPVVHPFVSPYHSTWFVGADVEDPQEGTSRITIENEEQLDKLKKAIMQARETKSEIVDYENTRMAIDDAEMLSDMAEKQLKEANRPITLDGDDCGKGYKVLVIKDNADFMHFSAESAGVERKSTYDFSVNPNMNPEYKLKDHQVEGVAWLQHLYQSGASGCLMADDMGLGKTLQVLYFIDWHARVHADHKPYLVVAPVSVLENWQREYERFFLSPRLNITRLRAGDVPRQVSRADIDRLSKADIILTNYETLRMVQLNLCAVEFDIIVLDEAQRIKTPGTMVTTAAKALKGNFKIAMTGTPVENTLRDLWCIMDFCVPGLLGNSKQFAAQYQSPLSKEEDVDIAAMGDELHEKLGMYFMRRMKSDVVNDLPDKQETKLPVKMPSVQESAYRAVINVYGEDMVLTAIMGIRSVSDHPYLGKKDFASYDADELIEASARLQAAVSVLDEVKSRNEKVIIFEERKDIQKMLRRICHERFGILPRVINGDTPPIVRSNSNNRMTRQATIDEFQAVPGFNIIIMSPLAAGMGLNVTGANHVIHHSRHWNPAKENQATDRVYRIGQDKDVFVYYPMAVSDSFKSYDLVLDELLERKNELAQSTIFPTDRLEVKLSEIGEALLGKGASSC